MQIDSSTIGSAPLYLLSGAGLVLVCLTVRLFPWKGLVAEPRRLHVLAVCAVSLMVLWSIRADVGGGLAIHLLGVTTVTLLAGPVRAALVTLLAQAVTGILGGDPAGVFCNWMLVSVLPIAVTDAWRRLVYRLLPKDPFAFIFGSAFFGAAVATLAVVLAGAALVSVSSPYGQAVESYPVEFMLLMAFPEAFVNGAIVTMLVVFSPGWLAAYGPGYERRRRL
jgi:uncharacterized membrane protein